MSMKKSSMIVGMSLLISISSALIPISYAESVELTLDETIERAVDESTDYRALKSTEESVNQSVRKAEFGTSMYTFSKEKYYDFIDMYYMKPNREPADRSDIRDGDVVGPFYFQDLIDMDKNKLMAYLGNALASLAPDIERGYYPTPSYVDKVMEEEKFIYYLLQFGNEQPSLTREEKFYKFIKSEELTVLEGQNGKAKFENGLLAIKNGVSSGASQLYMQYYGAVEGLKLSKENLVLRELMFNDVKSAFELGQVSTIEYETQRMNLEIEKLKLEQLELDVDSLGKAFNKLIGLALDDDVTLLLRNDVEDEDITKTLEVAYSKSLDLSNLSLDMSYSQKEFELMEKYIDLDDYNQDYEDVKEQLDQYKLEEERLKSNIATNYSYANFDLQYKNQKMKSAEIAQSFAKKNYENGRLMYELGLVKVSDLNGLGLQYANANMAYLNTKLAYEQSITNMNLLVSYGVEYK